jgi:hypothetical protein
MGLPSYPKAKELGDGAKADYLILFLFNDGMIIHESRKILKSLLFNKLNMWQN